MERMSQFFNHWFSFVFLKVEAVCSRSMETNNEPNCTVLRILPWSSVCTMLRKEHTDPGWMFASRFHGYKLYSCIYVRSMKTNNGCTELIMNLALIKTCGAVVL
nr:uncharacterized protein LOC119619088 [Chlorocebus sabaeus]